MNWTLFIVILIVGIAMYVAWMFYSQREVAYLSILLYRNGDADTYLKELNTFQGKLFFNQRLRTLMSIDAWIIKDDKVKLESAFDDARTHNLPAGDRMLVLQKELVFRLQNQQMDQAETVEQDIEKVYAAMSDKQKEKHESTMQETRYTASIYLHHSGKYADEIEKKAKEVKEEIPSGVYYYKAAQSWYLKKETKKCREDLEKAAQKLKGTPNQKYVQQILDAKDFDGIMEMHF